MLTAIQAKNAESREKQYKLFDGRGLHLLVHPNGGRYWRLKYRFAGKERTLALGVFPDVGLKQARQKVDEARRHLANGIDPGELRKQHQRTQTGADSFEALALEWFAKHTPAWAASHSEKVRLRLENELFPTLGRKPVSDVTASDLLMVLRRVDDRGARDTARRLRQYASAIFRYGIATQRCDRDPAADLRGALPAPKVRHYPTLTDPKEIGALLRAVDGFQGTYPVLCALRLLPLVFVRPGELRRAEWKDIDLDAGQWDIPAEQMKMRLPHIVPLSRQAVTILRDLEPLTERGRYVFPGARTSDRPMSDAAVNAALRRLGYAKEQLTAHSFRAMASTSLNEQGYNRDWIERQLAHVERNAVRAAYNRAEFLPERRKMMQAWADYLDALKAGGNVVSLRRSKDGALAG